MKPLGGMPNRVRLNVWCRRCEDDGRRDQGLLGQVQVSPDGVVLWATADPQRERHGPGQYAQLGGGVDARTGRGIGTRATGGERAAARRAERLVPGTAQA